VRTVVTATASALLFGSAVLAGAADGERIGRFVLQPADGGGFVRLDTETGAMSLCARRDAQWSCSEMADAGRDARLEASRLRAENEQLRAEIRRLEERLQSGAGAGVPPDPRGRPRDRLQLPSEEDVDRAITYLQRMYRKFRDKLKEFEDERHGGTPL